MDEVSILRARISILEKQMEKTNIQLREFIEAFEEYRRHSRPFIPEQQEGVVRPGAITLKDIDNKEWDYIVAMDEEDDLP